MAQLPLGGTTIFPRNRVVAYYGGPDGPQLGVLGSHSPDGIATSIEHRAAAFRPYGRPVQPAMELIATVAQGAPGPDGTYSRQIRDDQIAAYVAAAHRHRMLLILDFQPGTSEFLPQVQRLEKYLLDPWVSVALDPEWKVPPGQRPGNGRIGSATAASINAVGSYLSHLVRAHRLPDKLFVVHEFTTRMLPDRQNIRRFPGLEGVFHADGEGAPNVKRSVYAQLHFPVPPFHAGFKLFFTQDTRVMSPEEVMELRPQPEMITYQ